MHFETSANVADFRDEREEEPITPDVFRSEYDNLDKLKDAIFDFVGDREFSQIRDVRLNKNKDIEDSILVWQSGERYYLIRKLPDGRCWIVSVEEDRHVAWKGSDAFVEGIVSWQKE